MYKKILVGLDGSPRQPHVLETAVGLADATGAKLILCRAMQVPVSVPAMLWTLQGDEFEDFLVEHGQKDLGKIKEQIPQGLVEDVATMLGQPADVLVKIAEERNVDLVIIGSHGYDRIDRVLGTTAAKVTNRCPCSVLVVRGG